MIVSSYHVISPLLIHLFNMIVHLHIALHQHWHQYMRQLPRAGHYRHAMRALRHSVNVLYRKMAI